MLNLPAEFLKFRIFQTLLLESGNKPLDELFNPVAVMCGDAGCGLAILCRYANQSVCGEARVAGSSSGGGGKDTLSCKCCSILSMNVWSSIQATTSASPPHSEQIETSMLNTRFRRCVQVMALCSYSGVLSSFLRWVRPLARLAGVTSTRYLLLGAKTPWDLVKFTLGFGTRADSSDKMAA